jgi:ATP-dependent exoDNAse (exonuclease V) alpha subunit
MAIYHLSMKPVQRAVGRSATAAAAYRAGAVLSEEKTGLTFDYRRKSGVVHAEIVIPAARVRQDVQWPYDRERLWNAAEAAERRRDARVAREWEVALPVELSRRERLDLTRGFAQELADRYGCAVDFAIHGPGRGGDARNHHAHLLATTRTIEPEGLGRKTDIELGDSDRRNKGLGSGADELKTMRSRWAALTNAALAQSGHGGRVDHRSLAEQGIERPPQVHFGPAVVEMERRGIRTDVVDRATAEVAEERTILELRVRDLRGVRREIEAVESQAKAERQPVYDPDEVARQAMVRWKAMRAEAIAKEKADPRPDPFQQWLAWRKDCTDPNRSGRELSFEEWQRRESLRGSDRESGESLRIEQTMAEEREERRRHELKQQRDYGDDFDLA